ELVSLDGARREGDHVVLAGTGTVMLMGRPLEIPVTATLRAADPAASVRLGVSPALLVTADLTVDLRTTPLADRAGDFDDPQIGVRADLVLTPSNAHERKP